MHPHALVTPLRHLKRRRRRRSEAGGGRLEE